MNSVKFVRNIGGIDMTFDIDYSNVSDLFEAMGFYGNLPTLGPNGEKDLIFSRRVTTQGYIYHEINCKSAKQKMEFGIKNDEFKTIYAKSWIPMYEGDGSNDNQQSQPQMQNNVGYNQQQQNQQPQQQPQNQNFNGGQQNQQPQNFNNGGQQPQNQNFNNQPPQQNFNGGQQQSEKAAELLNEYKEGAPPQNNG